MLNFVYVKKLYCVTLCGLGGAQLPFYKFLPFDDPHNYIYQNNYVSVCIGSLLGEDSGKIFGLGSANKHLTLDEWANYNSSCSTVSGYNYNAWCVDHMLGIAIEVHTLFSMGH